MVMRVALIFCRHIRYHRLHHFLTEAPWSSSQVNERRARDHEQV